MSIAAPILIAVSLGLAARSAAEPAAPAFERGTLSPAEFASQARAAAADSPDSGPTAPVASVALRPEPAGHRDRFPGRPIPDRRPYPDYGRRALECVATDKGWEEHWGGHATRGWDLYGSRDAACRACKKPSGPHGDCNVRCSTPEYRCGYEFAPENGGPALDRGEGEPRENSYDAEESAMSRCMRNNWGRPGRCRVQACGRSDRDLLWERCR